MILLLLACLAASDTFADGVLSQGSKTVQELSAKPGFESCGGNDPNCDLQSLRVLSGFTLARTRIFGGAKAVGARLTAVGANMPMGDIALGRVEAAHLGNISPLRARITFAKSDVSFFCHDAQGVLHPPILGRIHQACTPDASWGVGFTLFEVQSDPSIRRFAARWGDLKAVYSLLGNGQGLDYTRRHLNLEAGTSFETVSHGNSITRVRALAGLRGLWRSPASRWELNGYALVRSGLVFESRFEALRHFLTRPSILLSAGIAGEVTHWQNSRESIGTFAASQDRTTTFIGMILEGRFEFTDL